MKLMVCVDKSNGMAFNNRRQSSDSSITQKILSIVGNNQLFVNEYSAKLFEGAKNLIICDDFLKIATNGDFCFAENCDIAECDADEIYLFCWNRDYPADLHFAIDLNSGYKKTKTENFAGKSHKKITLQIYKK